MNGAGGAWRTGGGTSDGLEPKAKAAVEVDAVAPGEFATQTATGLGADAQFLLTRSEQGFELRVALQAPRHVAHLDAGGLVAGVIAVAVLALTLLVELLPALDKLTGAALRIGADFRLKLEGANGAIELAAGRLVHQLRVLLIGRFRIPPAMRAYLLEGLAGVGEFANLLGRSLAGRVGRREDRVPRTGMPNKRAGSRLPQHRLWIVGSLLRERPGSVPELFA